MTPHLRGHVRAYVERSLPAPLLHVFDQHLVACEVCRALADQERRIVTALRADTGVPQSLRSSLIGLALAGEHQPPPVPEAPARVRLRVAEGAFRERPSVREPLATVSPSAPALHRSPMRAAVVASLAATASVAAAWGLTVVPLNVGASRGGAGRLPVEVSSSGSSSTGQAVSSRTAPRTESSRLTEDDTAPVGFGTASGSLIGGFDQTGPAGSNSAIGGPGLAAAGLAAPAWTTVTFSRPPVVAPVRISMVRSAQSSP